MQQTLPPSKNVEIQTQIYKAIENIAKPSSNIARITVTKDRKKTRQQHPSKPIKKYTLKPPLPNPPNPNKFNKPQTKPPPKKKSNLNELIAP